MANRGTGKPNEEESWEELREGAIPSDLRAGLEAPPEGVFRTDVPEGSLWRSIPTLLLAGATIGLCFWALFDRNLSWGRLLMYTVGGAVALCGVSVLPPFQKSLVREIRVTPDGFTVLRKGGKKEYAWNDLEAARFQDYPVVSLGGWVHCFLFRTGGKNVEVELGGLDVPTRRAFHAAAGWYLYMFDVPKQAPAMPSFGSQLSCVGAWVFVGGAFGMLVAHLLAYHTLGTVFGLAVMATGTCIAFMTRKERLSRLVLAATAALLLLGGALIWAFDINVRDVLNAWAKRERRLGRPTWGASEPKADGDEEAGPPRPATKADSVNERGERGPTPPASVQ